MKMKALPLALMLAIGVALDASAAVAPRGPKPVSITETAKGTQADADGDEFNQLFTVVTPKGYEGLLSISASGLTFSDMSASLGGTNLAFLSSNGSLVGSTTLLGAGTYQLSISGNSRVAGAVYTAMTNGNLAGVSITPVPEPESYAMFLAGLGIMGAVVRRRSKKA